MAMLNAPAMECDRVNLRWSVPVQKRQQIFETVPVRHRGTSFRVGQTFLMQLHRSRPEPRLSRFERCWLGGVTGGGAEPPRSGQATRATYSRSAPRISQPALPTCAPVKANGAARKAHERDKRATETGLRG